MWTADHQTPSKSNRDAIVSRVGVSRRESDEEFPASASKEMTAIAAPRLRLETHRNRRKALHGLLRVVPRQRSRDVQPVDMASYAQRDSLPLRQRKLSPDRAVARVE